MDVQGCEENRRIKQVKKRTEEVCARAENS